MKRILFCLGLFIFMAAVHTTTAQNLIDSEEQNFTDFYSKTLNTGKRAMPYAYLRESDVVWKTYVWRTIDFREKFNQFFYYPTEETRNTQGRTNLVYTFLHALANGDIEVYEDEDLTIPKDYQKIWGEMNKEKTQAIYEYDEWDEIVGQHDTIIHEDFNPEDVLTAHIKECWYIDKQDTRQKVRIVALALYRNDCRERSGERTCNMIPMFWAPMNDMRVRNALVKINAYDEHNDAAERTYDDIFIDRFFDSFVTRESNKYNRTIDSYLTGTDAIIESQRIEDQVFEIESDMWEY